MEIEIKAETSDFKIIEKIIRDMDLDIDGEKSIKKPHFQCQN